MALTPTDTVLAWLAAVNVGDAETAIERTAPDVAIIGPRGTGRGRDVLQAWLTHAGAAFATRAVYAGGDAVVVAQRGVWRDPASGAARGEVEVATRFRVADGRVAELQRYEELGAALGDAGLSAADFSPHPPDVPAAYRTVAADEAAQLSDGVHSSSPATSQLCR